MNGRDLSDPSTARDVAAKTGTVEKLRLLTLLTYGDISAVNPAAMTPWRRQLLWNLYTADVRRTDARTHRPNLCCRIRRPIPNLKRFLEGLPPRYLRTHSQRGDRGTSSAWIAKAAKDKTRGVAVSLAKSAAWVLTVVADDRPVSLCFHCRHAVEFRVQYPEGRSVLERARQSDRHFHLRRSLAHSRFESGGSRAGDPHRDKSRQR